MSQSDAYTDVVELCALLQCLGFSVKSLTTSDCNMSQDGSTRTVVINCQMSGLHVVLESATLSCSCPTTPSQQNSGVWEVSGVTGGKQLDKEFGCTLLGSLPKAHRERLTKELHDMIRCIKDHNESVERKEGKPSEVAENLKVDGDVSVEKLKEDKSASMTDLKTPEKILYQLKADTPTRYRSLDTLTTGKEVASELPAPGKLLRNRVASQCEDGQSREHKMCERQSTYTLGSTPGSIRRRNKTSSPIQGPQYTMIERLKDAERLAESLFNNLSYVIREFADDADARNDSSMSSLALDVSKISVLKAAETSRAQFASSPNLSRIARDDFAIRSLKRTDSASTSNLGPKSKESKISRLKHISPNIFKTKRDTTKVIGKKEEGKSKLNSLWKPKIITPVQKPRGPPATECSPNLSSASKKKFSHVKSTIPRLASAKKE